MKTNERTNEPTNETTNNDDSDASLFDGNAASWVEMASTNLLGTCLAAREAARDMRRRGQWGHIFTMVGLSGEREQHREREREKEFIG